jgi:PleD family two-component response regulator
LGSFLAGQTFSVALRRPQYIVSLYLDTCRFQAKGRRVATEAQPAKQTKLLVVEDDAMIGMLLADMLDELGYTVAAEAASIDEALEATRKTDFDLAILDADLKGRSVSTIADAEKENFERKFKDHPDGIIFDISHKGWLGATG